MKHDATDKFDGSGGSCPRGTRLSRGERAAVDVKRLTGTRQSTRRGEELCHCVHRHPGRAPPCLHRLRL